MTVSVLNRLLASLRGRRSRISPSDYWERRHAGLEDSLAAPGCLHMDEAANAEDYDVKWRHLYGLLGDLGRRGRLLDAGCGTGLFTRGFVQSGFEVTAVDFSPTAIAAARARVGDAVTWVVSPLDSFKCETGFDVVISVDVMFHVIDDEKFRRVIANLGSLVAPGGVLVIQEELVQDETDAAARPHAAHVRWRNLGAYMDALGDPWMLERHLRYRIPREDVEKDLLVFARRAERTSERPPGQ